MLGIEPRTTEVSTCTQPQLPLLWQSERHFNTLNSMTCVQSLPEYNFKALLRLAQNVQEKVGDMFNYFFLPPVTSIQTHEQLQGRPAVYCCATTKDTSSIFICSLKSSNCKKVKAASTFVILIQVVHDLDLFSKTKKIKLTKSRNREISFKTVYPATDQYFFCCTIS